MAPKQIEAKAGSDIQETTKHKWKIMIKYKKYTNNVEHIWYDSSNLEYTACYNGNREQKTLKAVFKKGATYLYKDVDINDYVAFTRTSASNGSAFNTYIVKKYKGIRMSDTDLSKLESLKREFEDENGKIEAALSPFSYMLEINDETGKFRLLMDGKPIYEGVEGQVSILNLLNSMHIQYETKELTEELYTEERFISEQESNG